MIEGWMEEHFTPDVRIGRRCHILTHQNGPVYKRIRAWAGTVMWGPLFPDRRAREPFPNVWSEFNPRPQRWLR